MADEAPAASIENETDKVEGGEEVEKVEGDMGDLKIEGEEGKKEEAPAEEEIGNMLIQKIHISNLNTIVDIDLTDPDVEAAAVKIQAAFGKKKAKK